MNKAKKRSITIEDVAAAAQVSISTVSRVINNKDDVSTETSERVKAIVREMGYSASLAARSMRSHRTGVIGLVMPDVEQSFPIQIMKGVNRAIAPLDYSLIVHTSGDFRKSFTADREQAYVSLLTNGITDGVIVVASTATKFLTDAPLVAVDPHTESPNFPSIMGANYEGAMSAVEYLVSLGHVRIGFIAGRVDLQSATARLAGYKAALQQAGLPLEAALIEQGDFLTESGRAGALNLLRLPQPPTAILAANDQMALGVLQAAAELGVAVPGALSVIGFDNIPESAYTQPALTTVDQFIVEMGTLATKVLIQLISGETLETQVIRTPTKLVIRQSCQGVTP